MAANNHRHQWVPVTQREFVERMVASGWGAEAIANAGTKHERCVSGCGRYRGGERTYDPDDRPGAKWAAACAEMGIECPA